MNTDGCYPGERSAAGRAGLAASTQMTLSVRFGMSPERAHMYTVNRGLPAGRAYNDMLQHLDFLSIPVFFRRLDNQIARRLIC